MEAVIVKQPTSKVVLKTLEKIIKIAYVIIIALMLYAPIVFMIILSFNKALSGNEFTGFTIEWYAQMFQKEKLMSAIITTLSVAALSTILSTVFGTISAIGINSLSKKARKNSIILNNVPILNADIVTGIFLFIIFKTLGNVIFNVEYPLGYFTLLLAHVFFSTPYVVLSVLPKLNQIDSNLYDAAVDLGCKPYQALTKVIIPSIAGGIFSGAMLAFSMSIDDFTISYFVSGSEVQNLSIWIYTSSGNTRYGNIQSAYAFYSILTVVMFVILVGYNIISSKKTKKK